MHRTLSALALLLAASPAPAPAQILGVGPGAPGGGAAGAARPRAAAPARPAGKWDRLPPAYRAELTRLLEGQRRVGLAAHNFSRAHTAWGEARSVGGTSDPWPRWFFERTLHPGGRRGLLTLVAKLRDEGVIDAIGAIGWVADASEGPNDAVFTFVETPGQDIRVRLAAKGYGDHYNAAGDDWGVRSPATGAQLHFRKSEHPTLDLYSVHVDLNNPGRGKGNWISQAGRGISHWYEDLEAREDTHTAELIQAAIRAQGIAVPDVDAVALPGGLVVSEWLKWETDESSWFGWLWLKPAAREAGWWTSSEGSRRFTAVNPGPAGTTDPADFRLTYGNGHVDLWIASGGALRARWFQTSTGKSREFTGRLDQGSAH